MNPRTTALTLLGLMTSTPADAVYLYWRDRSITYVPDELFYLQLSLGGLALLWPMSLNETSSPHRPSVK